ncbi:hypothetical protein E8A74_41540 [Polyangium fumosum]|uniref:Methylmalonyl-CoA mutase alpha/beta chain catalytic domain-containing protein n=1 Tax=Polyangium fumosum TaxID=889272 RepID=A0A4U1IVA5_9BACT|nr:hypothetical protein E8A74_41540 [Polyangium fumosum]
MTINTTAAILLSLYIAVADEAGVPRDKLRGTIQNDILKEYVARGTYVYPPRPSIRLISDIFAFCSKDVPYWNTISISGYHMREAGCDVAQEIAFTLADGMAYVKAAVEAGLDVDDFGGQLSFFFNGHNNLLEEIAKLRAARRIWSSIMEERFGAKTDRARALKFHCQTAGMTLLAQQPMVNVVRVAMQALAAVLGGCQSVTDFVDPLGGSYVVEALTTRLEQAAREYIRRVDDLGHLGEPARDGDEDRSAHRARTGRADARVARRAHRDPHHLTGCRCAGALPQTPPGLSAPGPGPARRWTQDDELRGAQFIAQADSRPAATLPEGILRAVGRTAHRAVLPPKVQRWRWSGSRGGQPLVGPGVKPRRHASLDDHVSPGS